MATTQRDSMGQHDRRAGSWVNFSVGSRRRRLSVFGHTVWLTQGTLAHNALHCQGASGRSLGRDWRRLPGRPRALDRPSPQRRCSCQPLEIGHPTGPWWSDATARAGYAMTTTTTTESRERKGFASSTPR